MRYGIKYEVRNQSGLSILKTKCADIPGKWPTTLKVFTRRNFMAMCPFNVEGDVRVLGSL